MSVINSFSFISHADNTRENMDLVVTAFSLSVYIWLTDWLTSVNYLCHIHLQRCVCSVPVYRCFLSATGGPAQWPDASRLVEAVCIRLCQLHHSAVKSPTSHVRAVVEGHPRRLPWHPRTGRVQLPGHGENRDAAVWTQPTYTDSVVCGFLSFFW